MTGVFANRNVCSLCKGSTFNEKKNLLTEVNRFCELASMLVTSEMGVQNLCRDNKYKVIPKINVVHNGCYFKLQEITFITCVIILWGNKRKV